MISYCIWRHLSFIQQMCLEITCSLEVVKGQVPCAGANPFFKWVRNSWHHPKNGRCHPLCGGVLLEGRYPTPYEPFRGGIFGQGQLPHKETGIFWTRPKTSARPARLSKKPIVLAFLKATSPQIPYWVHFISKVQNPKYMITSIE